jgi:hypothetical protein
MRTRRAPHPPRTPPRTLSAPSPHPSPHPPRTPPRTLPAPLPAPSLHPPRTPLCTLYAPSALGEESLLVHIAAVAGWVHMVAGATRRGGPRAYRRAPCRASRAQGRTSLRAGGPSPLPLPLRPYRPTYLLTYSPTRRLGDLLRCLLTARRLTAHSPRTGGRLPG